MAGRIFLEWKEYFWWALLKRLRNGCGALAKE